MDSIIESQRALHEEVERVQQAVVRALLETPKTTKEKVAQEHRIAAHLTRIQSRGKLLRDLYIDEDGSRARELDALTVGGDLGEFYQRLRALKDQHRRNPNAMAETMEAELMTVNVEREQEELDRMFSGEEAYGRQLDLNAHHLLYVNLKGADRVDYVTFLDRLDDFASVPAASKTADYDRYLQSLVDYLSSFIARSQPLLNVEMLNEETLAVFEEQWMQHLTAMNGGVPVDPAEQRRLYCRACAKQFAKQTVFDAHLPGKKHQKAAKRLEELRASGHDQGEEEDEELPMDKEKSRGWRQFLIKRYLELLHEAREDTKAAAERKLTLTSHEYDNRGGDDEEALVETSDDDSSDEEKIENPLKLPIGHDGRPIPYWIYKTYGLGIEYPCEICGNFKYMGRQAYQRHFGEWRHSQGLRCLGITNSKEFYEITLIEDAMELWKKVHAEQSEKAQRNQVLEEFEDAQGNIFNKKTYDDLRRQGLL